MTDPARTCFVIMPFRDMEGYEPGHFGRVYDHLIRPACLAAAVDAIRGDEVKGTNYIAIDILQRILKSDIVVCDLSGKNANVMYELGIRQAFDLPVVLLKDKKTERVFDIQGLRTLDYTESLRVDSVEQDRNALTQAISATLNLEAHEINSLVRLLGIEKAAIGKPTEVSVETGLVLASLKDISTRLVAVEEIAFRNASRNPPRTPTQLRISGNDRIEIVGRGTLAVGEEIFDTAGERHRALGKLKTINIRGLTIQQEGDEPFVIPLDDPQLEMLTSTPPR